MFGVLEGVAGGQDESGRISLLISFPPFLREALFQVSIDVKPDKSFLDPFPLDGCSRCTVQAHFAL